jgi:hypothetical protein
MSISMARANTMIPALLFSALLIGVILSPRPAAAEGALAVGLPNNVAKQGFAYAYSTGKYSMDEASAEALKTCKEPASNKSPEARAICAVIASFHDQCVAISEDPQAGTPGVGWAIADDLQTAEAQALAKCQETAGPKRRGACIVDNSRCDGTAK